MRPDDDDDDDEREMSAVIRTVRTRVGAKARRMTWTLFACVGVLAHVIVIVRADGVYDSASNGIVIGDDSASIAASLGGDCSFASAPSGCLVAETGSPATCSYETSCTLSPICGTLSGGLSINSGPANVCDSTKTCTPAIPEKCTGGGRKCVGGGICYKWNWRGKCKKRTSPVCTSIPRVCTPAVPEKCVTTPTKWKKTCTKVHPTPPTGKCTACTPGCKRSGDRKSCDCEFYEKAWDKTSSAMENAWSETSGWSEGALDTLQSEVQKLSEDIESTVHMIVQFFKGLNCDVGLGTMKDFISIFTKSMSDTKAAAFVSSVKANPSQWGDSMSGATVDGAWNDLVGDVGSVFDAVKQIIEKFKEDCPALQIDPAKAPVVTLGFFLEFEAHVGVSQARSGEYGIGMTLAGDRFTYAAACAESGLVLDSPGVSGAVGLALTGYKSISDVPGVSKYLTIGLGIDAPVIPPIPKFGIDGGVTLVFDSELNDKNGGFGGGNIIGFSLAVGPSIGTPGVPMISASFGLGFCVTMHCKLADDTDCGDYTGSRALLGAPLHRGVRTIQRHLVEHKYTFAPVVAALLIGVVALAPSRRANADDVRRALAAKSKSSYGAINL